MHCEQHCTDSSRKDTTICTAVESITNKVLTTYGNFITLFYKRYCVHTDEMQRMILTRIQLPVFYGFHSSVAQDSVFQDVMLCEGTQHLHL